MAPVTEFVYTSIKPGASLEPLAEGNKILLGQPGCQRVRSSLVHEDPSKLLLFIDWDSVAAHQRFMANDAVHGAFMGHIAPIAAGPAAISYVELAPHPSAVLDNAGGAGKSPVAEIAQLYFAAEGADWDAIAAAARTFVAGVAASAAGFTGESAVGWTVGADVEYRGEKCRSLVMILGWESVEVHVKAQETEIYSKLLAQLRGSVEGLKGAEIYHVSTKAA
ncbi:hypothetical protein F4779DRAFT_616346 [Xylariaceae sp. FL0662B]|nr:hypothetical protein F4779DRAFT_616346 [Xylariaceae sp. FL0662B]